MRASSFVVFLGTLVGLIGVCDSMAFAQTPPIPIEDIEDTIDSVASSPGDKKLKAIENFLAGMGLKVRLIKGDTVPLPLETAARLQVGTVKLTSKDGSSVVFEQRGTAILGFDGVWRKEAGRSQDPFRASIVISEKYIFLTDLTTGLMSRVMRPPVPQQI